jgi:hypothetical protein
MAEVNKIDARPTIDYQSRDYDSLLAAMRQLIPHKLPAWTDYQSEADFGNVLLQLFAHMGDILSYYQDRVANESYLGTARERRSLIQHLRLIGYRLGTAAPAAALVDLTVPAACNGRLAIRKGDAFATRSTKDTPSVRFEYTRDTPLEIDCSTLTPVNGRKSYRKIPVEEGRTIFDEIVGTSNGEANQRFALAHAGLILRSYGASQEFFRDVVLRAELGTTVEVWTMQESLAFSRASQRSFTVEVDENDEATLVFGDGTFGAIPAQGATLKVTYRIGGGIQGNVGPGRIDTIIEAPPLVLAGGQVRNPETATGGAERETIEHAVRQAPAVYRSRQRAVTRDDYVALALNFSGVGKARAEASSWNRVKLFVAPTGGGIATDVLKFNLLAYFEDKRPLTVQIEICDVDYVDVRLSAKVGVTSYYAQAEVGKRVQDAVSALLAFDNVDFAEPVYLSKFYEAIEALDGVDYVTITEFRRANGPAPLDETGKLVLSGNQIARVPQDAQYAAGIKLVLEGGY